MSTAHETPARQCLCAELITPWSERVPGPGQTRVLPGCDGQTTGACLVSSLMKHRIQKEHVMSHKQETATGNSDRERRVNALKRALLWLAAAGAAIFPLPWWGW